MNAKEILKKIKKSCDEIVFVIKISACKFAQEI